MSFSQNTKNELIDENEFRHACCRQSFCTGLLFCAEASADKSVTLHVTGEKLAEYAANLLGKQFGKQPEIKTVSRFGTSRCTLTFRSGAAHDLAARFADEKIPPEDSLHFHCEFCREQFYKAVFLTSGSVSDPQSGNQLEFLLPDAVTAAKLYKLLTEAGLSPKPVNRRSGCGLYFRSGSAVEDVFRLIGANRTLFDVLNVRIEREISNNENRATNCVARNISKAVKAALAQTAAIEKLTESGRINLLPKELQETAKLRVHHVDSSMEELAALHTPPISKSGLNHRLTRIIEEADSLQFEEKK